MNSIRLISAKILILFTVMTGVASAEGVANQCHLEFSTYTANLFGNYTVKKVLWHENYQSSSAECYAQVDYLLKKYQNVSTRWAHIDLTYRGDDGSVLSKASFVKP